MSLHNRIASQTGYLIGVVLIAAFIVGAIGGWIWNIVKLVGVISDPVTGMFILRCVGIVFPPLGAILGYL